MKTVIQKYDDYCKDTPEPLGFGDWLLEVFAPPSKHRLALLSFALVDTALAYAIARNAKTEWQKANQPEFDSETPEELESAIFHAHVLMVIVANELLSEQKKIAIVDGEQLTYKHPQSEKPSDPPARGSSQRDI